MEYNNTYLDEEELARLNQEQGHNGVGSGEFAEGQLGQGDPDGSSAPPPPIVDEEELLAAQAAADAAVAQQQAQPQPGGVFANVGQGLIGKHRDMMMQYWQETIDSVERDDHDFKNHQLPLARIKKVMKTDEEVKMISAEAPILFAKGCDVFITELTMRAWIHAEENKRRTLQKSDIAAALTKSDMFDFLIDVVPREEEKPKKPFPPSSRSVSYINAPLQHIPHQSQASMHIPNLRGSPGQMLTIATGVSGNTESGVTGTSILHHPQHQHQHIAHAQHAHGSSVPSHQLASNVLPLTSVPQHSARDHQVHLQAPLSPRSSNRSEDGHMRHLGHSQMPVIDRPMDEVVGGSEGLVKQEAPDTYGFGHYQSYDQNY